MTIINAEPSNTGSQEKPGDTKVAENHKLKRYSESVLSDDSYPFSNDDSDSNSNPLTPQTCHNTASLADCNVESIAQLLEIRSQNGKFFIFT